MRIKKASVIFAKMMGAFLFCSCKEDLREVFNSQKFESLLVARRTEGTALQLHYVGNVNARVEPCSCSIFPYGGVERRKNWLAETRAKQANTLVPELYLNYGAFFHSDSEKAHPLKDKKRVLEAEKEFKTDFIYFNKEDAGECASLKLSCPQSDGLYSVDSSTSFVPAKTSRVVGKLNFEVLGFEKFEDLSKAFPTSGDKRVLAVGTFDFSQFESIMNSTKPLVLIGSNTRLGHPECYSRGHNLMCDGSAETRSAVTLELFYSADPTAYWYSIDLVQKKLKEIESRIPSSSQTSAVIEGLPEDFSKANFYRISYDWLDEKYDNPKTSVKMNQKKKN